MGKVGLLYGSIRGLLTHFIKGNTIGEPLVKKVVNKEMSIWDAFKAYRKEVKTFALDDANKILPDNPTHAMKKYWQTHSGENFKLGEFLKEGKPLEWLVPAGLVLPEIGNIYRAFTDKDGGFKEGTSEVFKTGVRISGATLGSIAGCAIPIPFLGPIVGGMVGDWLTSFLTGKTHTERSAEHSGGSGGLTPEQIAAAAAAQQSGENSQLTPEQLAAIAAVQQSGGGNAASASGTGTGNVSFSGNSSNINSLASDFANQYNSLYTTPTTSLNTFGNNPFNAYNDYSNDFMAQSIFGNMKQNTSLNNNSPFSFPNLNGQLGYLS